MLYLSTLSLSIFKNTMKKVTAFAVLLAMALGSLAQNMQGPAAKSPKAEAKGTNVSISYNQPSKKGREIFAASGLVPFGKVWRTGANQATTITLAKDAKIKGTAVKAGTYTLFTIPGDKEWTIILNSQTGQWGTQYDQSKDVARITVPAKTGNDVVETFTISIAPHGSMEHITLQWDKTSVEIPVTF